ncbi:MAG: hypothetical protein E6Q06_04155 [Candidatus Moraniibacteriota bacterium]|nr:MAG: hypothetical protein E6Q06_04155 [Candidatus Moranbacteria bacterium]
MEYAQNEEARLRRNQGQELDPAYGSSLADYLPYDEAPTIGPAAATAAATDSAGILSSRSSSTFSINTVHEETADGAIPEPDRPFSNWLPVPTLDETASDEVEEIMSSEAQEPSSVEAQEPSSVEAGKRLLTLLLGRFSPSNFLVDTINPMKLYMPAQAWAQQRAPAHVQVSSAFQQAPIFPQPPYQLKRLLRTSDKKVSFSLFFSRSLALSYLFFSLSLSSSPTIEWCVNIAKKSTDGTIWDDTRINSTRIGLSSGLVRPLFL